MRQDEEQQGRERSTGVREGKGVHRRRDVIPTNTNSAAYSSVRVIAGFAATSSPTADAWVTVMSSSAPSDPSTIPASMRPLTSTRPESTCNIAVSSDVSPEKCATAVTIADKATVTESAPNVPSSATVVNGRKPLARYKTR